jgi:hypothetical protein
MKRVKSKSSLFLYYWFYDFNESKTVACPQFTVEIAMPFVYVFLRFSKNAYFSIDVEVFSTYVFEIHVTPRCRCNVGCITIS